MASSDYNPLSLESPIVRALIFYQTLLVLKMLFMSPFTAVHRFKNKAFISSEDACFKGFKVAVHEDIERIRRAHQNDLENILVFFLASWLYVMSGPTEFMSINLFRVFTAARFIHTFVYAIFVIPQPTRALAWFAGFAITGYMALVALIHFV